MFLLLKLLLLVGVASLAACGSGDAGGEADPEAAAEAAATEEAVEADTAQAAAIPFGQFTMTVEGKEMGIATFREDGFFSQAESDGFTLEGKWAMQDDGKVCVTIDGSDSDPVCFGVGATQSDGSWTLTAPDGEVGTLVPVKEG